MAHPEVLKDMIRRTLAIIGYESTTNLDTFIQWVLAEVVNVRATAEGADKHMADVYEALAKYAEAVKSEL